jgi:EipB-like
MNPLNLTSRICNIGLAVALLASTAQAASLVPHRAFYNLEADRLDEKGGITAISGKLAYEITGSDCDGYAVSFRIANRYVEGEGTPQTMDVRLTSFESGDGLELDTRQKEFMNARLDSELRIKVKKPNKDSEGEGSMSGKDEVSFKTEANAVFPTAFQKLLIEEAEKGQTRASALVFEGSDKSKSVKAISFIGAPKSGSNLKDVADAATLATLNQTKYWPMTVSYYDQDGGGDEQPSYQASFNMLENGVSTDLVLDYGTYALKGKLEKIELLKAESCK